MCVACCTVRQLRDYKQAISPSVLKILVELIPASCAQLEEDFIKSNPDWVAELQIMVTSKVCVVSQRRFPVCPPGTLPRTVLHLTGGSFLFSMVLCVIKCR